MPRCSVIVPVRDDAAVTRRAVEALLADPTASDAEVLLVAGGGGAVERLVAGPPGGGARQWGGRLPGVVSNARLLLPSVPRG